MKPSLLTFGIALGSWWGLLAAVLFLAAWPALFGSSPTNPNVYATLERLAVGLMWVAAAITVWTGWGYWRAANRALMAAH